MGLAALSTGLGYVLIFTLPAPLGAGLVALSPIYFLATTARASRDGVDWLAMGVGVFLAPLAQKAIGGRFDLPVLALAGGGFAWFVGFLARRAK
jgi:hypothetical protein